MADAGVVPDPIIPPDDVIIALVTSFLVREKLMTYLYRMARGHPYMEIGTSKFPRQSVVSRYLDRMIFEPYPLTFHTFADCLGVEVDGPSDKPFLRIKYPIWMETFNFFCDQAPTTRVTSGHAIRLLRGIPEGKP